MQGGLAAQAGGIDISNAINKNEDKLCGGLYALGHVYRAHIGEKVALSRSAHAPHLLP